MDKRKLIQITVSRFFMAVVFLMALFFLPARTWNYWEAWVYLACLFIPMFAVMTYLIRYAPDLLERRMRMKEQQAQQKLIITLSFLPTILAFLLPGFDRRFGWSDVPVWLIIASDILFLAGYGIVFWVFRENRYTSRVVEVDQGQTVISSGPYAVVRHPMYLGMILLYVFSPLALGSYWAMLPALLIIPILAARIKNEESVLAKELPGYPQYMQKIHNRLIPGVW